MAKLNHVSLRVRDWKLSRDWYVAHIGLVVEFEIPERKTAALQDAAGITLFVAETTDAHVAPTCGLFFEVDDVEETYRRLVASGLTFLSAPQKLFWGYGAELADPDGYRIGLWDERTMKAKGGA
jgi:catechol 2,3-dioxygenase-like lactoylglutathione lyase family enzyme